MQKWLFTPTTSFVGKVRNILLGLLILLIWVSLLLKFYPLFYGGPVGQISPFFIEWEPSQIYLIFAFFIFAPFLEEIVYRVAPITIGKYINQKTIIPIVIASSILFGEAHIRRDEPYFHILLQGVLGMVFSFIYIKNGYSYLSSVITHSIWNIIAIFLLPIILRLLS